ncbi:unnamed protein product [Lathyrus sativus]|nr:unnamed protein product [Lathyrus sativus]
MEIRFKCVVHHSGEFSSEFVNFTKLGYVGLEEIWNVDPDYWSYFEILDKLRELGYPTIDRLWYYDDMIDNDIVQLENDKGTDRMRTIVVLTGECHLYVTHHVSEPDVIEKPILSLSHVSILGEYMCGEGPAMVNNQDETTVAKDVVGEVYEGGSNECGTTLGEDVVEEGTRVDEVKENVGIEDNVGIEENVGDVGTNFETEMKVGQEEINCNNMDDVGTTCEMEENVDVGMNVGGDETNEGLNCN